MRDHIDDSPYPFIIERDREIETDRQTTPHTPHTPHYFKEKRKPIHIRMRESIHIAAMSYCSKTNMTAGQFYELSGIDYMKNNPPPEDEAITVIAPCEQEQGFDDKLQEVICVHDLESCLKTMPEKPVHIAYKKKLLRILKECRKVNNRGDRLTELLEEAKQYFD